MIIDVYIQNGGSAQRMTDSAGVLTTAKPALNVVTHDTLRLHFIDADAVPETLAAFSSFRAVLADDWSSATAPTVLITAGITQGADTIDIPLALDTAAMREKLENLASKDFGFELICYSTVDGSPVASLLVQFDVTVRNTRSRSTAPTVNAAADHYNRAEVDALLTQFVPPPDVEFTASSLNASHCLILTAADNSLNRRHTFSVYDASGVLQSGYAATYSGTGTTLALEIDLTSLVASVTGTWTVVFNA